jgi:RNA polymerase primary sigma factor
MLPLPSSRPSPRTRHADPDSVPAWDYTASGEQLTADQERRLARSAQAGEGAARDRLIAANIPLVVSVARNYSNPRLEAEDLIQEGMIGLFTAVQRFDPDRGFRFSTYATYWIKQRILRCLDRQGRMIRVPVDVGYAARKAQQLREQLAEELGREPALAELAPECGISVMRLKAVLECLEEPLPLDAPSEDDPSAPTLEVADTGRPSPVDVLLGEEQSREVESLLQTLSPRDRLVLEGRFGLRGKTVPLTELAHTLSMTREGVRQIQRRALLKLRRRLVAMPS